MHLEHAELMIRLVTAALLGAAVGLERERLEALAGLRTHMLVCLGAALAMVVSAYGFDDVIATGRVILDPSRVAAQVISGIGFLGAGTILFLRNEVVRGLTTAASLWTVAAIGLAVGCGLYAPAIGATVLVLVILALVKPLERRVFQRRRHPRVSVVLDRDRASLFELQRCFEASGIGVRRVEWRPGDLDDEDCVDFVLRRRSGAIDTALFATRLGRLPGVRKVEFAISQQPPIVQSRAIDRSRER